MGKVYCGVKIIYTPDGVEYLVRREKIVSLKSHPAKISKALASFAEKYEHARIKRVVEVVEPHSRKKRLYLALEGFSRDATPEQIAKAHEWERIIQERKAARKAAKRAKKAKKKAKKKRDD